jgi:hypothetical protein
MEAAAEYQMYITSLADFAEILGENIAAGQKAFEKLPEATMDVDEKKWDEVISKVGAARTALDPIGAALAAPKEPEAKPENPLTPLLTEYASLASEASEAAPSSAEAVKAGCDLLQTASDSLDGGDGAAAKATLGETVAKLAEGVTAAAGDAEKGGGAAVSIAQDHLKISRDLQRLTDRVRMKSSADSFGDADTPQALLTILTALEKAMADLNGAIVTMEQGALQPACESCNSAVASLESAAQALDNEAERLAENSDGLASIEPSAADFLEPFSKSLAAFEMFHGAQCLTGVPLRAPVADFVAAAESADADFLILIEPRQNNIRFVGHSKNWFCSFLAWSFAWFASNCIPDEKWESSVGLDCSVVDVRSRETLFTKPVDSKTTMNLTDIDDGYHFLGILTGAVNRDDLESAYKAVLPYHMMKIQGDILESLAVDFRAHTGTEGFASQRNMADSQGFGVVVGVSDYASDAFSGGVSQARKSNETWISQVRESSRILSRVSKALISQIGETGTSATSDTMEALSKAKKMLQMARAEFEVSDHPVGARSLNEAVAALAEAKNKLAVAEPAPENAAEVGGMIGTLLEAAEKASKTAADFTTPKEAVDLGKRVILLSPDLEAVPATLRETARKIGDEGAPLAAVAPKMEGALQNLKDVETALSINDLPTAIRVLKIVSRSTSEAMAALEPLKAKAIEAASVAGKISFLKIEIGKALVEAKALSVPETLASLGKDCSSMGLETETVMTALDSEAGRAEVRVADRRAVADAAAPAVEKLDAAAKHLQDASDHLGSRDGRSAAASIRGAAALAEEVAEVLAPKVKSLPTFVGEILKAVEDLRSLAADQEALVRKVGESGPTKESLGDLPGPQRKVGQEMTTFAGEIEAQVQTLKNEGKPVADEVAQCAKDMRALAETAETAAQNLELFDIPATVKAQEEGKAKMVALAAALKKLAPQVPEVGKHAYAMDSAVSRQEALILQSNSVTETLKKAMEPHAASQDAVLKKGAAAAATLASLAGAYPKAKTEEPEVLSAVQTTAEELGSALSRGVEGAAMLREGDALGGRRELENLLERLSGKGDVLAAAVEGKRSHVDWIKQVVSDLTAFAEDAEPTASALEAGGSKIALDRAQEDAANMAAFLADPQGAGFSPTRVKTLLGAQATREGILGAFDDLLKNRVLEKDLFVFYFAGCGGLKRVQYVRADDVEKLMEILEGDASRIAALVDKAKNIEPSEEVKALQTGVQERKKAITDLVAKIMALSAEAGKGMDSGRAGAFASGKAELDKGKAALEIVISHLENEEWAEALKAVDPVNEALKAHLPHAETVLESASGNTALADKVATAGRSIEKLAPLRALEDVIFALAPALSKAEKISRKLSTLHGSFKGEGKSSEAEEVSQLSSDLRSAVSKLRAGRSALVDAQTSVGMASVRSGHSTLKNVVDRVSRMAKKEDEVGFLEKDLLKIANQVTDALDEYKKAARLPEVRDTVENLRSVAGSVATAATELNDLFEAEKAEAEEKAQAAAPLSVLAGSFDKPLAGVGKVTECLGMCDLPGAAEAARETAAGLDSLVETAAGLPTIEGVDPLREGVVAESGAFGGFAEQVAITPIPSDITQIADEVEGLLEQFGQDKETAARLREACKDNVPEPAGALGVALDKFSASITLAQESIDLIRKNEIGQGHQKLNAALESCRGASGALKDMSESMSDVFRRYILPQDADPMSPDDTAISLFKLGDLVSTLAAKHAYLIFDASFAPGTPARGLGVMGGGKGPKALSDQYVQYMVRRPDWTAIFAGGPGQGAAQGGKPAAGILTAIIIEGMSGKADSNGDTNVSLAELQQYLEMQVPARAKEAGADQTPVVRGGEVKSAAFVPGGSGK